jgi:branched-chain amino acid transport system permease protein
MARNNRIFWLVALAILAGGAGLTGIVANEFYFFAAYVILQFVVLATAWNIMGGYMGYVNFGTAAFFAVGAYTTVVLYKLFQLPLPLMIIAAGIVCGLIGLGTGYLTLRLRGIFFAIATLALAIVLETLIINWDFVGGASGTYVLRPREAPLFGTYVKMLFVLMLFLAIVSVALARYLEHSRIGRGLAAIRDDETAAECMGVPTLRLKLLATSASGALMGIAGAPYPFYVAYLDPPSAFNLSYSVYAIAMPMIGGATSWVGPLIGAILLGGGQQIANVTISSEINLLIVGLLLVVFVTLAPDGIVGMVRKWMGKRK